MPKIKKIERETVEMPYGYTVRQHQRCTHSTREPVEYGSWSESYSNSIDKLIEKTTTYPDVVSLHDLQSGDRAYVVWVEWSTGDSFGRGECAQMEVLGLFKTYEDAEVLKDAIEATEENYSRTSFESDQSAYWVKTPDGQIFTSGWAPWLGYFESLEGVHIDRVEVR